MRHGTVRKVSDNEAIEKATGLTPKQMKGIMDGFYKPQIAMAHTAGRREALEEVQRVWIDITCKNPDAVGGKNFYEWLRTQLDKDGEK